MSHMGGRNRVPRHPDHYHGSRNVPQPLMDRGPAALLRHSVALEEELEIQCREVQRIIAENRLIIDDNTIFQRELTAAKDEIHRLREVIPKIRAEMDAQIRELVERNLKLEADLGASEPLRVEVVQLRAEVQRLNTLRKDLSAQVQTLRKDVTSLEAENKQINATRAEIDLMRKDLVEARRAFEFEKKANEEQVAQMQAMESNLVSMAREMEKLRAEKLNAERSRGLGSRGYGIGNGGSEWRYPGSAHGNGYGGSWGHYDMHGPRQC